ncbi:nucleotidyltransferase family protein [Chitinophaga sancti]|uniref:D-glycero-alpha-D-manno-heptose 1-phosphate guanylyltransferase n=1 Tax=Chitinophaga sancti TaxID=1004 RepID=A0A1K1RYN6_9BACT|nr:nucleotidyltransferase family protein [Chitinophaga sancti]WQD64120.1 nucleotidyltransferase family protein [Chitinophaga sancti]WQG90256.1 nucleotidyltransferase family protein [Chitinophaga sancti]SFW77150.1 D-glycero-alpha-D-manno-heptose 1-phosphate guanylyltransferase [Chitinophaga sancti]
MITECIVLAGGLGTRLRSVVADKPKCMAPVGDVPFIDYLLRYLLKEGMTHVVLSLGHLSEQVITYIESNEWTMKVDFVIEEEPLGTGGAIMNALEELEEDEFFILNGDTLFNVDLFDYSNWHQEKGSKLSLALKPMQKFDRYGSVELDENNKITAFLEKQYCDEGLINGGIYVANREYLEGLGLPEKFSFEKDVLELQVKNGEVYGFESDSYFIDIGVPADYERAQKELV